ncbi:CaiB/BaiF CoA transferase family protein [Pollutimonas bauzanensis]|uniref:Alpha-methylacyl-CoA racemase n=1 Tax=Pollutimonas bauzanensis TaxID=658167 RepID=A0A1M5QJT0_9BURK|nr:CaiB/BaiF CoA-transferase family protein [Pollutimonas bauzanensis]SHH14377.1 alpha-methylacyl-CoA racemase [Pollutimonas bauzanensis]
MGTLSGLTVIEMAGLGPAPFCAMMLADLGARVIRIERQEARDSQYNVLLRNRESIVIDAKKPEGRDLVLDLIEKADILIEGFRPGVMERLGLGPDKCLEQNPRLVYGRMTGWGQEGPLARTAGHDINYISLAGVTHSMSRPGERPRHPLNLVGDYGGGGMLLAYGLMAGVWEAQRTGMGQVIDCAMVDGASTLLAECYTFSAQGKFQGDPGTHLLDGGAHFYNCYETLDRKYVSVGPLEAKFYTEFLSRLGIDDPGWLDQYDEDQWPVRREQLAALFKQRTRDEWCALLDSAEVCFAPVLAFAEVADNPHIKARRTLIEIDGVVQPAPSPRFSRTASAVPHPARLPGQDTRAILAGFGYEDDRISGLFDNGVVNGPAMEGQSQSHHSTAGARQ